MRTIQLYGVTHAYPSENQHLSAFLRDCCQAMNLTVPIEFIDDNTYIQEQVLKRIKKDQEDSVRLSWIQNPEQMGR